VGRKRNRQGQYVYLFLAGMILFSGTSCERLRAPFPGPSVEPSPPTMTERWDHLQPVQARIENKDFDGAVQVYQDMLDGPSRDGNPDLALYDLGLLYAHYANPKKDYKKSLLCFSRLSREYPASPFAEEARIWINVLESMEKAQRVDIELELKKKEKTR